MIVAIPKSIQPQAFFEAQLKPCQGKGDVYLSNELHLVGDIVECLVLQSVESYYSLVLELKTQVIAEKLFNVSIDDNVSLLHSVQAFNGRYFLEE